jgi:single-stranded DNA-binding protein
MVDTNPAPNNAYPPDDVSRANDFRLAGRVAGDAIFRGLDGRRFLQFRLAVERDYRDVSDREEKQVTYVPVAVGGTLATYCRPFLRDGTPIYIEGRVHSHTVKTPDGGQRTQLRFDAFKVQSLARGQSRSQGQDIAD